MIQNFISFWYGISYRSDMEFHIVLIWNFISFWYSISYRFDIKRCNMIWNFISLRSRQFFTWLGSNYGFIRKVKILHYDINIKFMNRKVPDPTPIFTLRKMCMHFYSVCLFLKRFFLDILTKPKACITGTFLSFSNPNR